MTDSELEKRFQSWQSTAHAPEALVERAITGLPTRPRRRRTLPLFLTTAAVAVGIAGYFYNEKQQGRWQFEQVVHALEKAHDVRWVDSMTMFSLGSDSQQQEENYITVDPPRHIVRSVLVKDSRIVFVPYTRQTDARGTVQYQAFHFVFDEKHHLVRDNHPVWIVERPGVTTSRYSNKQWKSNPTDQVRYMLESVINPASRNQAWRRRTVMEDGKSYLELFHEFVDSRSRRTQTLLIDPETHWLVRETSEQFELKTGRLEARSVRSGFRYNEPPPQDIILTEPPKGVKIINQRQLLSIWPQLSAKDQKSIQAQITQAEKAWREADVAAFCKRMAFDFPTDGRDAERRRNWERRVQAQKGRWERWESKVVSASADGKLLGVGVHTDVKGTIEGQPVASDWEEGQFRFRREKDGLKLVGWDYPKDSVIQMHSKMIAQ